jgi:hypothetical protein
LVLVAEFPVLATYFQFWVFDRNLPVVRFSVVDCFVFVPVAVKTVRFFDSLGFLPLLVL